MGTLREDLLPTVDDGRALVDDLGFRTSSLTIRTRTWSGEPGVSAQVDDDLVITPPPKIRQVTGREVAGSAGRYEEGDLRADKITPSYSGGGYTPAQLKPDGADGVEVLYIVGGPNAGEYTLQDDDFTKNFGYTLILRRKLTNP